jgi:hypothetical protein
MKIAYARFGFFPLAMLFAACGSGESYSGDFAPGDDAGTAQDGGPLGAGDDGGLTTSPDGGKPAVVGTPLVDNLTIREVALFQTVKLGLMKEGAAVTPSVPPVADRAGLFRVYVAPGAGYSPHEIQAQLTLQSGGVSTVYPVDVTPSATSTESSLSSTINFSVPAGVIKADTKFAVALKEKAGTGAGANDAGRWPSGEALASLGAVSTGPQLKVVLVPFAYGADGSNRLPDTSAAQVQRYKDRLTALYPTPKVDVTVRPQPVTISFAVSPNGNGISTLLNTLLQTRAQDNPSRDTYYYGLVVPSATFGGFCGGGCVSGLSPLVGNPNDAASRGSVGLGFTGAGSAGTMAHEIGHAHGRSHAPCGGAGGADPSYPYAGGSIGVWGYDQSLGKLMDPAQYKDLMGYCNPDWFSDYQYGAILTRVRTVNGASIRPGAPMAYQFGGFDTTGAIAWTGSAPLDLTPGGEPRDVEYLGLAGQVVATKVGYVYELDHLPGGVIIAPPMVPGAVRARLARRFVGQVMQPMLTNR